MVVVVDYGVGNIGSILNMLKKIGVEAVGATTASGIASADKLILPGVGSFDRAMQKLEESGMLPALEKRVTVDKTPSLGICLGMQILAHASEEGSKAGLGWVNARVVRFSQEKAVGKIRIPHMGWNEVRIARSHSLFSGLEEYAKFYFVHSYHVECDAEDVLSTTTYGYEFVSGIGKGNIFGVQFHPEKSHKYGFRLLKNFAEL